MPRPILFQNCVHLLKRSHMNLLCCRSKHHGMPKNTRRKAAQFSRKLKHYTVPTRLQELVEDRDIEGILRFVPSLTQVMSFEFYLSLNLHKLESRENCFYYGIEQFSPSLKSARVSESAHYKVYKTIVVLTVMSINCL